MSKATILFFAGYALLGASTVAYLYQENGILGGMAAAGGFLCFAGVLLGLRNEVGEEEF